MPFGQLGLELQRSSRRSARLLHAFGDGQPSAPGLRMVSPRQPGPRERKRRIAVERLPVETHAARDIGLGDAQDVEATLQIEPIGFGIVASAARGRLHLGDDIAARSGGRALAQQRRAQLGDHRVRDVRLNREDVVERAVVDFRPQVRIACRIDQLRGDADALPGTADAAFEHRRDVELLRDRRYVDVLALEEERRSARCDAQSADLRQHVQELVGEPVGEVLVLFVAAQVDEGKHGDRRRECLRRSGAAACRASRQRCRRRLGTLRVSPAPLAGVTAKARTSRAMFFSFCGPRSESAMPRSS